MTKFVLPPVITELVIARDRVRRHYAVPGLSFTLDGKLVGDIGEAVAAELFGLTLKPGGGTGIDGHAPDNRSVQVKATGTGRGPVFRKVDARADHLIFIEFDFERLEGEVVFNGPEHVALQDMPETWTGQRPVLPRRIRLLNETVAEADRLPVVERRPSGDIPEPEKSVTEHSV
ncbi:hypothetical protein RLEG12_25845 [Rhizobium leguminosarum bv. trifolii CB782]|uniref:DUF6998 domain-containing protein n=1 Tax=Rhizobium hidalgonense TaxID=1538159 RepID=UPI0003E2CC0F|nr:hypothetical protein [Rhizobium hidalgonense]AHG46449.1 hypothetical protein RLEG12_25845 [Rhizobium leguminosarum bv. trifolii CB782]RWX10413.1 hypothetical protein EHI42_25755 [Rhizobium hidalgonense]